MEWNNFEPENKSSAKSRVVNEKKKRKKYKQTNTNPHTLKQLSNEIKNWTIK